MIAASVALAAHNKGAQLPFVLDAFGRQNVNLNTFEVLVVDHGSTDNTHEVIAGYAGNVRLSYLYLPRKEYAISPVRNMALQHAQGEILIISDADIVPCREFVSSHTECHRHTARQVVLGCMFAVAWTPDRWRDEDLEKPDFRDLDTLFRLARASPVLADPRVSWVRELGGITRFPSPWLFFWTGNVSISRSLLTEVGGFDERITRSEDLDLGYRLFKAGAEFVFSERAAGFHCPHTRDYQADEELDRLGETYMLHKYRSAEMELLVEFGFNAAPPQMVAYGAFQRAIQKAAPNTLGCQAAAFMVWRSRNPGHKIVVLGLTEQRVCSDPLVVSASDWSGELVSVPIVSHLIGFSLIDSSDFDDLMLGQQWTCLPPDWLVALIRKASVCGKRVALMCPTERDVATATRCLRVELSAVPVIERVPECANWHLVWAECPGAGR